MPRKKMTEGQKSSLAARKALVEIKRTVPTGKRHSETGLPIKERQSFYGKTKEEAEEKLREHLRLLSRPQTDSADVRPGSMAWWYLERYAPLKSHLRPSSKAAMDLAFSHLWTQLGNAPASKVGAKEIAAMVARVGKSASLRNKVRGLALDLLELASEEDPNVRPVSRRRVARVKDPAPRVDVLSPQEARALCESVAPHYRPAVYLMAFLGLRSGEAIAVVGGDLTPLGTLSIKRQDDGKRGWTWDLKTEESRRELPIPHELWPLLITHRAESGVPITRTRDVSSGRGTQVDEAVLRRAVAAARRRLGLPSAKGHTLHALRHGCATWLATNGCPDSVRLAILGQSRSRVSTRYVHASPAAMLPHLEAMWAASEGSGAKPAERKGNEKNHATGMRNGRAKIDDERRARILARLDEGGPDNAVKKIARDEGISPKAVRNARARGAEGTLSSTESVVATTTSS